MSIPTFHFLDHESVGRRLLGRLLPLIVFLGTGIATELIIFEDQRRQASIRQQKLSSYSGEIRAIIESELNATIHLASGLVAFIQAKNGNYQIEEINPWLGQLQKNERGIRNITLAPGNRIQHIFPNQGNESVIGLYFPDVPEQWPVINKIISSKRPALVGPFQLKQGGLALAYRVPVFLEDTSYWGLITSILDADQIFQSAKQRAQALGLNFALIDLDHGEASVSLYSNLAPSTDRNVGTLVKANNHRDKLESNNGVITKLNFPGRDVALYTSLQDEETGNIFSNLQRTAGWLFAALMGFLLVRIFAAYHRQTQTYFALNESQQRFLSVFNAAPQGMALIDENGKWISVNPMLCDILGYDDHSLLHVPPHRLSSKLGIDNLQQRWIDQGQAHLQFELDLRHRTGRLVSCQLSISLIAPEQLGKKYWILQAVDISRRIAAERQLHSSAEYTQTILDNVAEGIVSTTLNGDLRSINPAAIAIWKLSATQVAQFRYTNFLQLLSGIGHLGDLSDNSDIRSQSLNDEHNKSLKIAQEIDDYVRDVRDYGASQIPCLRLESIVMDQQGNTIHIEFSISATEQKEETELIIVIRDISERKRLEQMQSDFVSIVSHELRTPLTSIIGSLKLIEGGVFGSLPDSLGRMIRIALQNGQQLALIINDILDMNKLVAGQMSFDIQAFALMPLIKVALESNSGFAKQHQVEILILDTLPNCKVMVDPLRLQQILSNLLSNAAKYSKAQGKVEIRLEPLATHLKISVQDYGEGIPQEAQVKLFKKFSQVDSSSTRKKGGTGLGLSIAKEMVQRMQGEIGFTSTEGLGSVFYFTIPLATASHDLVDSPPTD